MKEKPITPPVAKQPALTPEQVEALARLEDPNYGKPKPAARAKDKPKEALQPPPVETPPKDEKTPPAASAPAVPAKKPWEEQRDPKGMNFQPDAALYAKMVWCKENVPMMSLLKLLRQGAEAETDRLIALHYKEPT